MMGRPFRARWRGSEGQGRYLAGDVYGQKQGNKRRKRTELAVAIDGVAVYLYDILSSQAVTSYLVSPQSVFTCAPYSLRWRPTSSKTATRYTYVSLTTSGASSAKREIKLFREEISSAGTTTVTPVSHTIRCDAPVIHLFATSPRGSVTNLPSDESPNHDIIAVAADGTVLCLNGETLEERWQVAPSVLTKELLSGPKSAVNVELAQSTLAADVVEGIFGGKNELFGVFQEKIHRDGFNPDFLVVITTEESSQARHLHVLALPSEREARQTNNERLISVFVAPLPAEPATTKYQLDVRSGTLQVLSGGVITTYSFSNGIPRSENRLQVPHLASFLRLSKTSVLTSAADCFSIYNPIYRSLQATTPLSSESESIKGPCEFITYLASREIAVGLRGGDLVAVQIEAPKNRTTKRRAEGLLTDAIRRGIPRDQTCQKRARADHPTSAILEEPLLDMSGPEWQSKLKQADDLLHDSGLQSWEEFLAQIFKVQTKPSETEAEKGAFVNGTTPAHLPEWVWPSSRAEYARVDRRWVFYAISRVFSWAEQSEESKAPRLACRLPESSVLNYLVDAGHLSTSNIKSAFKDEARATDEVENIIGEEVPVLLAQIDPTMALLLAYLSGTQLGTTELVSSIKLLLHSLGLFEDSAKLLHRLTEKGEDADAQENEAINMELDRAEEELQITEQYLDGHRTRGLGVAFNKLAACPAIATVQSLRRLFKPEEIIGLMNVLRAELIKDGWTTRYLDRTGADQDDLESPPDGSIQLIADLMSRCIDSVGLGGWMASDAMLSRSSPDHHDSADFFSQFQAEISVALEGILEAVRLQGALAEAVGYAKRARKALVDSAKGKAVVLHAGDELPLGLKTDSRIAAEKVRSGGEIVTRSSREMGHFVSKKRGLYSVHRISEEMLLGGAGATVVQEAQSFWKYWKIWKPGTKKAKSEMGGAPRFFTHPHSLLLTRVTLKACPTRQQDGNKERRHPNTHPPPAIESVDSLARTVFRRARESGTGFVDLAIAVRNLITTLKHLHAQAHHPTSDLRKLDPGITTARERQDSVYGRQLRLLVEDTDLALRQARTVIERYGDGTWGEAARRNSDLAERTRKVELSRGDVISQTMKIDTFLETVHDTTKDRMSDKIDFQEMKELQRKVEAIASRLFSERWDRPPTDVDDDELWRSFRRELEKEGFASDVLRKNKVPPLPLFVPRTPDATA
ncbi:hypothetical protein N0V88_007642 [Collariella sp. IMI 366227]|nr:hypothetical protein N0V88_007642 [Collariella sp. IMI 366227]